MKNLLQSAKNGLIEEGFDPNDPFIKGMLAMVSILEKRLDPMDKRLVTVKKAHQLTGASTSFFKQLLREKKLTKFKVNSATYISLSEFENIAVEETPPVRKRIKAHILGILKEEDVIIKNMNE